MAESAPVYSLAPARALKSFVAETARAINAGRMLPGKVLELEQTCDELGIPLAKLRHGLQDLEIEGLILDAGPGRVVVAPLDSGRLDRVFSLRRALEPEVLCNACRTSPVVNFDDLRDATRNLSTIDWRFDEVFSSVQRVFLDFVVPTVSPVEFNVVQELLGMSERSARIGFSEVRRSYPADVEILNEQCWELVGACQARSVAGVREADERFLELIEDVSRQGVRAVESLSA
ncbi:hypothetical protein [Pseudonocardia spinosispora]|uniref:hypothetical protein n=1 Tax=Pseudonocardia spinosispora TaxID=103441 RepID=UPI0003FD5BC2|nr:hypothetical protein [Pseudonocardia spinosispora]